VCGDMPDFKLAVCICLSIIFLTPHIVSGEETLEYTSLTQNEDIAHIQTLAKAEQAENSVNMSNVEEYKKIIFNKIKTASLSNKLSQKGEVGISFMLDSNGQLKGEPKAVSSSNQNLNKVAVDSIKNASPFPAFPKELNEKEESFYINLEYK